jgi:tryptophan synthase alpha chain
MNRIAYQFANPCQGDKACFVAYVCAGDPDYATSVEVCKTLVEGNVDVLEIGVPFSDPMADGLTNQLAAQRALDAGATQEQVFNLVREVRKLSDKPIIFYTYYNLVFSLGVDNYIKHAKEAGVDGILVLDMPPEESEEVAVACAKYDVKTVFIVAPTTPPERIELIAKSTTGFIYYVSREGVTGERATLASNIGDAVTEIKKHTECPVVVGFGISTAEHVSQVAEHADGVVVGSALVNCIARNVGDKAKILSELKSKLDDLTSGLK